MTQPCHKHTTLNQQCRNSEHKDRRARQDKTRQNTVPPHTPHFPTHNKQGEAKQRTGTMQEERPNTNTGTPQHTPPRSSIRSQGERQGGRQHADGRPASQHPPFTYHATPPSTMPPPTTL
nr:MAG TPA: hypothetical protein [Caudoviricetes sp.]